MSVSPSIIPTDRLDRDIYLVLEDFRNGAAWCETDEDDTDRETVVRYLMQGQFKNPIRIVCFNTGEGWARDVTGEIAEELHQRCAARGGVPPLLEGFLGHYEHQVDIQLSLL
jgi:hypothetical protein